MPRSTPFALFALLVGCSSSDPVASATDPSTDTACGAPQLLIYEAPGCGRSVAPVCRDPKDTGCVTTVCGCDGVVHVYDCTGSQTPYRSTWDGGATAGDRCADAGVEVDAADATDTSDTADSGAEAGICGAGKHPAYVTPGCSATPTCLPDGPEDACASTFCGCDGTTFFGACGYSPRPFVSVGACPDAGDGG